jgi:hypothetical protein
VGPNDSCNVVGYRGTRTSLEYFGVSNLEISQTDGSNVPPISVGFCFLNFVSPIQLKILSRDSYNYLNYRFHVAIHQQAQNK